MEINSIIVPVDEVVVVVLEAADAVDVGVVAVGDIPGDITRTASIIKQIFILSEGSNFSTVTPYIRQHTKPLREWGVVGLSTAPAPLERALSVTLTGVLSP